MTYVRAIAQRHARCLGWAALGVLVGLAISSARADDGAAAAASDPLVELVMRLTDHNGLSVVLGVIAWWARGKFGAGIPVTVRLADEDRQLLARLVPPAPPPGG